MTQFLVETETIQVRRFRMNSGVFVCDKTCVMNFLLVSDLNQPDFILLKFNGIPKSRDQFQKFVGCKMGSINSTAEWMEFSLLKRPSSLRKKVCL